MAVIYKATNKNNGKAYVGFAVNFEKRKRDHEKKMIRGNGEFFHNALKKHGFDAFDWMILKEDATLDDEITFIESESTFWKTGKGYNLTRGGEGKLGYIASDDTRKKLSIVRRKRGTTEKQLEVLRRNALRMKEIGHTEETKRKISESHRGKVFTEEHKRNISENHASKGPAGAYYQSSEYKEKMSKAKSGHTHSEETKRKMSESRKKYWAERRKE